MLHFQTRATQSRTTQPHTTGIAEGLKPTLAGHRKATEAWQTVAPCCIPAVTGGAETMQSIWVLIHRYRTYYIADVTKCCDIHSITSQQLSVSVCLCVNQGGTNHNRFSPCPVSWASQSMRCLLLPSNLGPITCECIRVHFRSRDKDDSMLHTNITALYFNRMGVIANWSFTLWE